MEEKNQTVQFQWIDLDLIVLLENRRTEEGYKIYTVDELNLGKGKQAIYDMEN